MNTELNFSAWEVGGETRKTAYAVPENTVPDIIPGYSRGYPLRPVVVTIKATNGRVTGAEVAGNVVRKYGSAGLTSKTETFFCTHRDASWNNGTPEWIKALAEYDERADR